MKYIPASKLQPNSLLGRDLILPTGKVLLKKGAKLDPFYIDMIMKYEIDSVCIASEHELHNEDVSSEMLQEYKRIARAHKKELFKYALTDSMMEELYEAVVENAAWELIREE